MSPDIAMVMSNNFEEDEADTGNDQSQEDRKKAKEYFVREGDTISSVAAKYGIKTQTLLWANSLDENTIVHPGDKLTIPPEDGVMYTVKRGDTLLAIAQKYSSKISEIMEFNQLDSEGNIVEGQPLFLPGGKIPAVPPRPAPTPTRQSSLASQRNSSSRATSSITIRRGSGSGHRFPYGYCTWYVAQRRGGVPWGGNAKEWLANARSAGYATGSAPVAGAIMVTRESWWGHVAYVESVSGGMVTISEMNHVGWGVVSRRTLPQDSWVIRGYIY